MYPRVDMDEIVENLFPDDEQNHHNHKNNQHQPSAPPEAIEEVLIKLPGAILHLIDRQYSVELASGDFTILRLRQGDNILAVLARVDNEIQWPLAKDEAIVKLNQGRIQFLVSLPLTQYPASVPELNDSHYFFSLHVSSENDSDSSEDDEGSTSTSNYSETLLNYGLTFAAKGQEFLLGELDMVLAHYGSFSIQKISEEVMKSEVLNGTIEKETSPDDLKYEKNKEMMEKRCAAYWTTLAPNVEDYGGNAAKLIAKGSGQLIKGILWCGDVTVDRLNWGNDVLTKKISPTTKSEINPQTLKRIKRVKKMTRMTEKVAGGVLTGVVRVSGYFTNSVANSKVGQKLFRLLPGEMVLASLDGFSKICDAVEVAGKSVMSTSSTVTTGLVSHRYGEEAGRATDESLNAAGHAIGTAWAVFKIRQALNPKSVVKPPSLLKSSAKAAASEIKAKVASKK